MSVGSPVATCCPPQERFRTLSATQVMEALSDPDRANPIACEVARLVEGYTTNFAALVTRLGHIPEDVMLASPNSPIETVAMQLMTETIRNAVEWQS